MRGPARAVLAVLGGLLGLVGAVWIGQGAGWIGGSFMTGDRTWLGIGLLCLAVGGFAVYAALRHPPRA